MLPNRLILGIYFSVAKKVATAAKIIIKKVTTARLLVNGVAVRGLISVKLF